MERLSEYEDDVTEESVSEKLTELMRVAALGRRVEALLASEEPPEGLMAAHLSSGLPSSRASARAAWAWFREQLLEPIPHPWRSKPGDLDLDDLDGEIAAGRAVAREVPRAEAVARLGSLATGSINPAEESEVSFILDESFGDPPSRMVAPGDGLVGSGKGEPTLFDRRGHPIIGLQLSPPPANIPEAGRGPLLGSLATGGTTGGRDGE